MHEEKLNIAENFVQGNHQDASSEKTIFDLIDLALIPQGVEIPRPEIVFALDDIPIFTKKSISTLTGKAKAGKTTVSAWVVAQCITHDMKVVWIDTEQGLYYGSRTQHWVLIIAGMFESSNLKFYDLKVHNPTVRANILEEILKIEEPDLVIIDGIRDLVFDINSPEEATIMTGNLMKWAETHDCHIMNILHLNKGNEQVRGHLGTEMINKSESVIKVEKQDDNTTVCTAEYTRSEAFQPFAFQRDERGIPQMLDGFKQTSSSGEANKKRFMPTDSDPETHKEMLNKVFGPEEGMSYGDLQHGLVSIYEQHGIAMGINKSKMFIAFYLQNGYISKLPPVQGKKNSTFYSLNVGFRMPIPNNPYPF